MWPRPAFDLLQQAERGTAYAGRWRSRVRDLPEFDGEFPVATMADEMLTPGNRPGARAHHRRRQPGAVDTERQQARRRAERARLHRLRRSVPERDDAPRRRDPAAGDRPRGRALRRDLPPLRGAQHRAVQRGAVRHRAGAALRLADIRSAARAHDGQVRQEPARTPRHRPASGPVPHEPERAARTPARHRLRPDAAVLAGPPVHRRRPREARPAGVRGRPRAPGNASSPRPSRSSS